jgi:hypothetical protein
MVKAVVPAYVSMDITLTSTGDTSSVDTDSLKEYISTYINGLTIGRGFLSVSDLAVVINSQYSNLTLNFPAKLGLNTYLPDGTVNQDETQEGVIYMYEDATQGVTSRNTSFFCRPGDVTITIKE